MVSALSKGKGPDASYRLTVSSNGRMRFVGRRVVPGAVPDTDPCPPAGRFAAKYQVHIGLDDGLLRCHCSSQKRCRRDGCVDRLAAFTFLASLIAAAAQQQDIPRFRGGIDVVQFTVTVLDKDRHPVTGLTAADFEVLVDGKPRPLAAFAAVTLPGDTSRAPRRRHPLRQMSRRTSCRRRAASSSSSWTVRRQAANRCRRRAPWPTPRSIASARRILAPSCSRLPGCSSTHRESRPTAHGSTLPSPRLSCGALQEPPPPPSLADVVAARGATPRTKPLNRVQLASEELSGECHCGVCVPDTLTALAKELSGPD